MIVPCAIPTAAVAQTAARNPATTEINSGAPSLYTPRIASAETTEAMLIMWPIMAVLYYRLARREEREMEAEFGASYRQYMQRSSMFLPWPKSNPA